MCSNNSVTAILCEEAVAVLSLLKHDLHARLTYQMYREPLMQCFPSLGELFNTFLKCNLQNINRSFWIHFIRDILSKRVEVVSQYHNGDADDCTVEEEEEEENWLNTGCFYFLDKVRNRPLYPLYEGETNRQAVSANPGNCNKFFDTYGSKGITNGAMVLHCPHGFFIGYHLFNTSEGLNDVFSSLFTRYKLCKIISNQICSNGYI